MLRRRKREISRDNGKFLGIWRQKNFYLGGILRRGKRKIFQDPEKFSVFRTILETKKFLSELKNGEFSVFAVLIYPPESKNREFSVFSVLIYPPGGLGVL